ncbi:hypothetical protein Dxin01_00869 [Deinococcus xinjiangensis]|uniref:Prepilin-type N-terminal cleavage/methylation domain-containing protein n=1 Tax=Deinococcus xinjiangensis TaxID=457454 RepID=A0ABP9VAU8_9DEIO
MKSSSTGLTIIEVLVALAVFAVLMVAVTTTLLSSLRTNRQTELRTKVTRAAETWADRYRGGLEPRLTTKSCVVSSNTLTCTYPANYAYPTSEWSKWDSDFRSIMQPFSHVVTLTVLTPSGNSVQLNELNIKTTYLDAGQPKVIKFTTKVVY